MWRCLFWPSFLLQLPYPQNHFIVKVFPACSYSLLSRSINPIWRLSRLRSTEWGWILRTELFSASSTAIMYKVSVASEHTRRAKGKNSGKCLHCYLAKPHLWLRQPLLLLLLPKKRGKSENLAERKKKKGKSCHFKGSWTQKSLWEKISSKRSLFVWDIKGFPLLSRRRGFGILRKKFHPRN